MDAGNLFCKMSPGNTASRQYWEESASLIIQAYNQMKYDALNIGELDLALGLDFLLQLSDQATFPFISSNLFDKENYLLVFKPYLIIAIKRWRIGILGVLSPNAAENNPEFFVQDPFLTAKEMVEELRRKADLIICLSNLGLSGDKRLCQMVPGIHIIIESGSGILFSKPLIENDTSIFQAYQKGEYIGILEIKKISSPSETFHPSHYQNAVVALDHTYLDDLGVGAMISQFKERHNLSPPLPFPPTR